MSLHKFFRFSAVVRKEKNIPEELRVQGSKNGRMRILDLILNYGAYGKTYLNCRTIMLDPVPSYETYRKRHEYSDEDVESPSELLDLWKKYLNTRTRMLDPLSATGSLENALGNPNEILFCNTIK